MLFDSLRAWVRLILSIIMVMCAICQADAEDDIFAAVDSEQSAKLQQSIKSTKMAQIIAINKVTTQRAILKIRQSEIVYFGNAAIELQACNKINNPYAPDNQIYLSIAEELVGEDPKQIFQGWLFSSSPSLNVVEHPIYQIFAMSCIDG